MPRLWACPDTVAMKMSASRPILFATDGSPCASEAQRTAIELASQLCAPLVVVAVIRPALPPAGYGAHGYSNVVAAAARAEHERLEELLASVADAADQVGVSCATVLANRRIAEEICRRASAYDARLIVVGSHGWSAARRLVSGSVSTGLVHTAPCPVLVVRDSYLAHEQAAA
jgi:nucleotide-binding universal stress UspA family protein